MPRPGTLVLVVGPSGAGKDTLINCARDRLAEDARFAFPRRIVTRTAMEELEPHESIDRPAFDRMRARGDYALCWEAHGLGYLLPAEIDSLLAEGKTVICNVSRRVLWDAKARYPDLLVVMVAADRAVRAQRLASRGRETEAGITARLAREAMALPPGIDILEIDNSGSLDNSVHQFVDVLMHAANVTASREDAT